MYIGAALSTPDCFITLNNHINFMSMIGAILLHIPERRCMSGEVATEDNWAKVTQHTMLVLV